MGKKQALIWFQDLSSSDCFHLDLIKFGVGMNVYEVFV